VVSPLSSVLVIAIATVRVMDNHLTLGQKVESGLASSDARRYVIRLVYG
jgi:ABC-type bacteriocin/lantibiotic exporter with double-glycine peptidase domain